ncbi:MAG: hypothetical protein V1800_07645 [Candidatus Latescibacterota bacterium]
MPEAKKSEETATRPGKQDRPEISEADPFDALFAYLDGREQGTEAPSPIDPPESPQATADQESPLTAWEISEEAEGQDLEAPNGEPVLPSTLPDPGECGSGVVLEKLRVLEEQLLSLESCMALRTHSQS